MAVRARLRASFYGFGDFILEALTVLGAVLTTASLAVVAVGTLFAVWLCTVVMATAIFWVPLGIVIALLAWALG